MIEIAPRDNNAGECALPRAVQTIQVHTRKLPTANASRFAEVECPVIEKKGTCKLISVKRPGFAEVKSSMWLAVTNPRAL